jgi:hypothetical protein
MSKGLDFDELYPGRFIKAGDLKGRDVNLTITKVRIEELEGTKGKQTKGIVSFKESRKEIVLNRTNGECLKAMFGRDTGEWVGKRVTLYPAKIESDIADLAIRVRGSPDLAADVTFSLALARKRPREVTMKRTPTAKGNGKPAPPPEPEPDDASEPITDPETGEVFPG